MTEDERLDYLLQSETIRKVDAGELTPKDLDTRIGLLKQEIKELQNLRMMDMAEIVTMRRQVEVLMEGDNGKTY